MNTYHQQQQSTNMSIFTRFYASNTTPTQQKLTDDEESVASEEVEQTWNKYVLGNPLYSDTVYNNIQYEKYRCDAKTLIPNVTNWSYNRPLDMTHVAQIKNQLRQMQHPFLIGSIKILKDLESDNLQILDGQHRVVAIHELITEDATFTLQLDVDVFVVEKIEENDISIHELFMMANNNKNISINQIPQKKTIEVIDLMRQCWPQNIKTDDKKSAYKPNITKRELYQVLNKRITETASLMNKSYKDIFKKIFDINAKLRVKPLKDLFGRVAVSQRRLSMYEKAKKHDFFLNMEGNFGLEIWVNMLE
jgi:hypothetical protein